MSASRSALVLLLVASLLAVSCGVASEDRREADTGVAEASRDESAPRWDVHILPSRLEPPSPRPAQTLRAKGAVLSVDEDENVVLALGADDGMRKGFRGTIFRNRYFVTVIEITKVRASDSTGRPIVSLRKMAPQPGDGVRFR